MKMNENDLENDSGETQADWKDNIKSYFRNKKNKNARATSNDESKNYDMDVARPGDPCGKCIIFNFCNFSNSKSKSRSKVSGLKSREGTGFDRDRLIRLFSWLEFDVRIHEDMTKDDMEKKLKAEASDYKNEEFKCLVVCILSHGEDGIIYTADEKFIELNAIRNRFNNSGCKSFENKPKIFIVQACRDQPEHFPVVKCTETYDQVVYQATSSGSLAWRKRDRGSLFIQIFCQVYEESAHEDSFYDLVLKINTRFSELKMQDMCSIDPLVLIKKIHFKPKAPFKISEDKQCHSVETVWKVTIISHSSEKDIEELENQVEAFTVLQDKMNEHTITVHRPNQEQRMHFKDWKEKECSAYIKRYYKDVAFILFNYEDFKDDIPNGFKCFLENNKPSFIIKNYNLFEHFDFLKLADDLTFRQKESLKRIKHMDHIGFDPKRNAIYFFKISDQKTVHDIRADIEDSATFLRMFFLLHQRELENKITCLVSFVVVPTEEENPQTKEKIQTTSLLKEVSKICGDCEQYLITKKEFLKFDKTLCKKIVNTVSSVDKIELKDEDLKKFKYNMSGIFAFMATKGGKLIPNLTKNTSEQLEYVIMLYPQQMEIANFNDKRVILKGSYGSGKTIIGRLLVKHLCCDPPNGIKIYYIHCGASSDFTEDMQKYVTTIDKNNNVACRHNTNALGSILKEIKQKHTSAEKVHLIFDEVPLDEISEDEIASFSNDLNDDLFDETFCYVICQAMSKQRSLTNNGVDFKTSFGGQEEMLKKSDFKIKELKRAVRNTQNIDQLVEIAMNHLEDAANKFVFLESKGETSSEEDQITHDIQSQNQIEKSSVEIKPAEDREEVHKEDYVEDQLLHKESINEKPIKAKEFSNLDAKFKSVNIPHVNQEDQYLKSEFTYVKHLGTLEVEGKTPRLYFPLEKGNWDQVEEVYWLMQCFDHLLDDSRGSSFFDFSNDKSDKDNSEKDNFYNDKNIILIHFENKTPETVIRAIEMMKEPEVENIIFKSCFDVQGLEYKNVIIVLDIAEYHMRHYLIEAITRCQVNLAFLVVGEKLKDQDPISNIVQEWEAEKLIETIDKYSRDKLSEHKKEYECRYGVDPVQIFDDAIKKSDESIIKELLRSHKLIDDDSSSGEFGKEQQCNLMLYELGKNLTKVNIEDFIALMRSKDLPEMESSGITDGHDLLKTLERKQLISPQDVALLKEYLPLIGRTDLKIKVDEYEESDIDAVTSQIEEIKISDEISKDSGSNNPKKQSHLLRADTSSDEYDDDYSNEYDMRGDQCGRCIIINQNFHKSVKTKNSKRLLKSRDGTKADLDRLQKMYRWLKFEVTVYEDVTKDDLETLFKKEAADKKNDSSKCLIVCILSHGKEGGIYTSDGDFYKMQDILNLFDGENCTSLICKPKLFFIQACQGSKDGKYVQFDKAGATEDEDESYQSPKKADKYLAANADQFVFYSSTPDNVSWRSPIEGSWFIQTVCSVFEKSAHKKNFYELVLQLNNRIAKYGQKLADETVASMMSSVGQNTLRKIVQFHPDKPFKDFVSDSRIMQATS